MAILLYGCTGNPAGPKVSGLSASTGSSSYSAQSQMIVTIKNNSGHTGVFNSGGGRWDVIRQDKNSNNWINVNSLGCVAIYGWTIVSIDNDGVHTEIYPEQFLSPAQIALATYIFEYHYSISPDGSVSDALFSNTVTVR